MGVFQLLEIVLKGSVLQQLSFDEFGQGFGFLLGWFG